MDSAAQLAIAQALHGVRAPQSPPPTAPHRPANVRVQTAPPDALREVADASRDGESLVTADVGSAGSADHITDDLNDVMPYPTGYMGKNSEVAWIQRVAHQLAQEARDDSPSQYTEGSLCLGVRDLSTKRRAEPQLMTSTSSRHRRTTWTM